VDVRYVRVAVIHSLRLKSYLLIIHDQVVKRAVSLPFVVTVRGERQHEAYC